MENFQLHATRYAILPWRFFAIHTFYSNAGFILCKPSVISRLQFCGYVCSDSSMEFTKLLDYHWV